MSDIQNQVQKVISEKLEQLAMLQYRGDIKGALIIVIDKENVFRIMEAYASDVLFAMSSGIDIAKDNAVQKMKVNLTGAKEVD